MTSSRISSDRVRVVLDVELYRRRLFSLAEPPRALDDEDIQFLNIERRRQHELDRMQREHDNEELKEFFVCDNAIRCSTARCSTFLALQASCTRSCVLGWDSECEQFRCL